MSYQVEKRLLIQGDFGNFNAYQDSEAEKYSLVPISEVSRGLNQFDSLEECQNKKVATMITASFGGLLLGLATKIVIAGVLSSPAGIPVLIAIFFVGAVFISLSIIAEVHSGHVNGESNWEIFYNRMIPLFKCAVIGLGIGLAIGSFPGMLNVGRAIYGAIFMLMGTPFAVITCSRVSEVNDIIEARELSQNLLT